MSGQKQQAGQEGGGSAAVCRCVVAAERPDDCAANAQHPGRHSAVSCTMPCAGPLPMQQPPPLCDDDASSSSISAGAKVTFDGSEAEGSSGGVLRRQTSSIYDLHSRRRQRLILLAAAIASILVPFTGGPRAAALDALVCCMLARAMHHCACTSCAQCIHVRYTHTGISSGVAHHTTHAHTRTLRPAAQTQSTCQHWQPWGGSCAPTQTWWLRP